MQQAPGSYFSFRSGAQSFRSVSSYRAVVSGVLLHHPHCKEIAPLSRKKKSHLVLVASATTSQEHQVDHKATPDNVIMIGVIAFMTNLYIRKSDSGMRCRHQVQVVEVV